MAWKSLFYVVMMHADVSIGRRRFGLGNVPSALRQIRMPVLPSSHLSVLVLAVTQNYIDHFRFINVHQLTF